MFCSELNWMFLSIFMFLTFFRLHTTVEAPQVRSSYHCFPFNTTIEWVFGSDELAKVWLLLMKELYVERWIVSPWVALLEPRSALLKKIRSSPRWSQFVRSVLSYVMFMLRTAFAHSALPCYVFIYVKVTYYILEWSCFSRKQEKVYDCMVKSVVAIKESYQE